MPDQFSTGTKNFGVALNAIQFLVLHKIFGPAQNILGHVEGQGISNNMRFSDSF